MNSLLPSQEHLELCNTGASSLHDHLSKKEMRRIHRDSFTIPTHPCRPRNRERRQHYALDAKRQSDNERSSRDARKKRPPQGRVSNRQAEHSMGRIEAYNIKIATNRTGDLVRRKQDQEMAKTEVGRMVDRLSASMGFKEDKSRT